jgi:hypothetical protein
MLSRCAGYSMNNLFNCNLMGAIYRPILLTILAFAMTWDCHAEWTILKVDGTKITVSHVDILDNGTLKIGDDTVKAGDWCQLNQLNNHQAISRTRPWVIFNNRDQLAASLVRSDGNQITVDWPLVEGKQREFSVALSSVTAAFSVYPRDLQLIEERTKLRNRDQLWKTNDEVLTGSIESFTVDEFKFHDGTTSKPITRSGINAIWFNTELARLRDPKELYYRLSFIDGSYLSATKVRMTDNVCEFTLLNKKVVSAPAKTILQIDVERAGESISRQ